MAHTAHPTGTELLARLLDGGRTWGALQISATRYGMTRYRLVVFPPGTSREERIALRLWRAFPFWGVATWLVLQLALTPLTGPGLASAVATGACLTAGAFTMIRSSGTRGRVRTLTVVRMVGVNDADVAQPLMELRCLTDRLVRADAGRAAGVLSDVEHEAEVWRVYDKLA